MRYGSVCSGIEAATAAWHHMGWEPAFFSEIEAFPRAVLEHHYPKVPLHGDFTTIEKNQYGKIDLLVGGTPCQSFSIAGLRGGLDDERGNLALEFCRLAQREQPRWIVWENVPGVLSSNGGRDFGSILGALEDLGYGLAYRVLDAQYFGVAQRRRRVFVVGYLGDWRPAAAVLFERHSMSGHPAPSREARKEAARNASVSTHECGGIGSYSESDVSSPLLRSGADKGHGCEALITGGDGLAVNIANGEPRLADVTGTLDCWSAKGRGSSQQLAVLQQQPYSVMPMNSGKDYKARETEVAQPIMAGGPVGGNQSGDYIVTPFDTTQITSPHNYSKPQGGDPCHPLAAGAHPPAIAIQERAICENPNAGPDGIGVRTDDVAYTLEARATPQAVAFAQNTRDEVRLVGGDGEIAGALSAQPGTKQQTYIALSAKDYGADATENLSPTLRADGFTNSHQNGGVMPAVAIGFNEDGSARTLTARYDSSPCADRGPDVVVHSGTTRDVSPAITSNYGKQIDSSDTALGPNVETTGFRYGNHQQDTLHSEEGVMSTLPGGSNDNGGRYTKSVVNSAVRRLTPVECERLQGFPDNFTAIPWRKKAAEDCPDGPRYKALGNSMAVPVMRWIGERIQVIDDFVSLL